MTTKVTNIYNLKLTPSQFGQNSIVVNCSQYDSLFRVIQFNLFNGNAVYSIPEGSVVTIRGTKKDNTGFEYECDYSNNVVTFPLQQQITIFPGKVPAELRITNNGEIIGSWNFLFLVEESPLSDDTTISETQLPLLEQAIEAAGQLNEAFDDITEFTDETYPNAVQAIQNEGATQVSNVTNEGTAQRGLVSSEGATQIANVQAEATTQKGLVTSEGTTQVGNVQAKGTEVLDSIPSDYTELSGEVEDLKTSLDELESAFVTDKKVITGNLINVDDYVIGSLNYLTGVVDASLDTYRTTDFERVNPNSAYSVFLDTSLANNSSVICCYDKQKNFLIGKAPTGTNTLNTPSNAYYIRVSYASAFASRNIRCVEGVENKPWVSYSNEVVLETPFLTKSDVVITNHLYVSPNGNDTTGDGSESNPFKTIYHANEVITDNTEMNRYVIHVADGFYTDLQSKYAGTYSGQYEGIICKDYVSYIGNVKNPTDCTIAWNGATGFDTVTNEQICDKCPFHIVMDGSTVGLHTEIAGFAIVGRNLRYALHVDTAGYGRDVDWFVHDCEFVWSGRPNSTDNTEDVPAIGTGSSKFEKGYLLRCKIQNAVGLHNGFVNHDTTDRYGSAYTSFGEGADIKIESCNFAGNANQNTSIWMRNMYASDGVNGYDRLHVINCTGINELKYTTANSAVMKWRAEAPCSDIASNLFKQNGYDF